MPPRFDPAWSRFDMFGVSHWIAIVLTFVLAAALIVVGRRKPYDAAPGKIDWTLAVLLVAVYPMALAILFRYGWQNVDNALPLHLCDVAGFIGAVALITRKQILCELAYFWGLAGTVQALFTPDIKVDFPHAEYFRFFLLHGGLVAVALYIPWGLRRAPRPGAIWRVLGWSQVYLLVAGVVNYAVGSNYGFLRKKPDAETLLDVMGPWPWYIGALELAGATLFVILYLPFYFLRKSAPPEVDADV